MMVGATFEPDGGGEPSSSQKYRSNLTVFGPLGRLVNPGEDSKPDVIGLLSRLRVHSVLPNKSSSMRFVSGEPIFCKTGDVRL